MNRLTKVDEKGYYIDDPSVLWDERRRGPEITRLGEYEDTGVTPENICKIIKLANEVTCKVKNLHSHVMSMREER